MSTESKSRAGTSGADFSASEITRLMAELEQEGVKSQRYRLAAESATNLIYEWDLGSRVEWLGQVDELLGYQPNEIPRTWEGYTSLLHSEDRERVLAAVEKQLKSDEPYSVECRVKRKDGDYLYWQDQGTVVRDESGKPVKWVGAISDITKRKRAELKIASLAKFLSENPYPVLRLSRDGIVMYANAASGTIMDKWGCAVGGTAPPFWRDLAAQALANKKNETEDIECDGKVYSMVVTPVPEPGYVNLYGLDITARKQAEALFQQERESFLDLINNQPAGIYRLRVFPREQWRKDAWDSSEFPPYALEMVNDRFCEILGINRQLFESNPGFLIDLIHTEDKAEFARKNEEANTKLIPFQWEGRLIIGGKILWVHFESLPRPAANGEVLWMGILYDITERKRLAEKLEYSAVHDALTGLLNRHSLEEMLNRSIARAKRGVVSSLLYMDFDNFKEVNDTVGHTAGDNVLNTLSNILKAELRTEDVIFRVGGDEFAVLLEGTDGEKSQPVAERLRVAVEAHPFELERRVFHLSLSIGLIEIDGTLETGVLLSQADAAMYRAKEQGKNRVIMA
jgi:diguanylate cyclase (GGDEF)-like protein/PAS domain S-box-containing protein